MPGMSHGGANVELCSIVQVPHGPQCEGGERFVALTYWRADDKDVARIFLVFLRSSNRP